MHLSTLHLEALITTGTVILQPEAYPEHIGEQARALGHGYSIVYEEDGTYVLDVRCHGGQILCPRTESECSCTNFGGW